MDSLKQLLLTLTAIVFIATTGSTTIATEMIPPFNEDEIIERLEAMQCDVLQPRYTTVVKGYVKGYVTWGRSHTQKLLGRSVMYFPIFEKYLKEYGLPQDLKYLSVVESALHPKIVSKVGARGLWQFMPATGKEMGLKINKYVDERCDPHKSSEAAARYLRRQYKRFGSWELALAAYNGGSGRVSRAIKRGRSKNFWRIRKYLPKETRNYIPAYIGAAYLMNHYDKHGLRPTLPELDMQLTETITVYDYLAFSRIEKLTGVSLELIETLNPAYNSAFIPSNITGNTLTLPKRVMPAMKAYFDERKPDQGEIAERGESKEYIIPSKEAYYEPVVYTLGGQENLYQLIEELDLTVESICAWNNLHPKRPYVEPGHELTLFGIILQFEIEALPPMEPIDVVDELPSLPIAAIKKEEEVLQPNTSKLDGVLYYTIVQKKETLSDIAAKFASVTVQDLMLLNNFRSNQVPRRGNKIKVKKL